MHIHTYLCGVLWAHLGQNGPQHLVPLLQDLGILSDEVTRNGDLHIILEGGAGHMALSNASLWLRPSEVSTVYWQELYHTRASHCSSFICCKRLEMSL